MTVIAATSIGTLHVHSYGMSLDGLVTNSPFGPASVVASSDAQVGVSLEFRGVLIEQGGPVFSLYDASTRRSMWVGLRESGYPYLVRSFDEASNRIQVDCKGRSFTLALKQAMAATSPVNAVVMMPVTPLRKEMARMDWMMKDISRQRADRYPMR